MKIFFNHDRLHAKSNTRGVGVYTRELSQALQKNFPQDEIFSELDSGIIPDLIHYPYFDPFTPTLKVSRTVPTVVTIHDLIPLRFPRHFPVGWRGRFSWLRQLSALRRVAHVITDSLASKNDILKITALPSDLVTVVPLGPNPSQKVGLGMSDKIASSYSLPPKYLLYVGDINWNKNVTGLIQAFAKINAPDLYLVLVGKVFSDRPDIPEFRELASALAKSGLSDRILLLGFVPSHHLSVLYSRATLYVQPSWYEGFGLPVLEAMKFGCPVASSSRGSLPELGGEAVSYFDPGKNMAKTIASLLQNPARRQILSAAGLVRAKEYTWEKTAQATHAVYAQVLSARR